jgi:hypothetical protein
MKRNFQTIVVLHQVLIFSALVVQSITDSWLPPEIQSFLGVERTVLEEGANATSSNQMIDTLWWVVTIISLLASAGIIFFRRWGRTLFVFASILNLLSMPFSELYVDVGWTVFVGSVGGIIEGMIISLMFFSPLRRLFK